jgi:hypothetical protein
MELVEQVTVVAPQVFRLTRTTVMTVELAVTPARPAVLAAAAAVEQLR